ncbi:hypothetical protein [Moorena sp. SIO4G3]|uniref:hypothetical protein n=1 Tax=Moorena sp. SIO4G3 TaxID=2607821 RepID=UPI00142B897A|nr:hypothetical protein [Moorena sp. SIO4G3]NEO81601.1 hypothetical protein [Moorena sp. SIO4G3]
MRECLFSVPYSLFPTPRSAVPFAIGIGCHISHTFLSGHGYRLIGLSYLSWVGRDLSIIARQTGTPLLLS